MKPKQYTYFRLSARLNVNTWDSLAGRMTTDEWLRLARSLDRANNSPSRNSMHHILYDGCLHED